MCDALSNFKLYAFKSTIYFQFCVFSGPVSELCVVPSVLLFLNSVLFQVHQLQEQVGILAEHQATNDDRLVNLWAELS